MAIVTARYIRNRTTAKVSRSATWHVRYCTYDREQQAELSQQRRELEQQEGVNQSAGEAAREVGQRGDWYDPSGKQQTFDSVLGWAQAEAKQHPYLYHIVLSTREGTPMTPQDFRAAMAENGRFADWRLIEHTNTPCAHAHALAFSNTIMGRAETALWYQHLREELQAYEREYQQQLEAARGQHQAPGLEHGAAPDLSAEQAATRAPTLDAGPDLGF